jgi:hypothetical protein
MIDTYLQSCIDKLRTLRLGSKESPKPKISSDIYQRHDYSEGFTIKPHNYSGLTICKKDIKDDDIHLLLDVTSLPKDIVIEILLYAFHIPPDPNCKIQMTVDYKAEQIWKFIRIYQDRGVPSNYTLSNYTDIKPYLLTCVQTYFQPYFQKYSKIR